MIWEFCKYCNINGKCENQDRGRKCETGYKILYEENDKLKNLLKECIIYVDRYVAFSVVQGNKEREVKSKELLDKIDEVLK